MDNNKSKTIGEEMMKGLDLLSESFFKMKSDLEAKLTPEQRIEYDKQFEKQNGNEIITDLKKKIELIKNFGKT